MSGVLVDSNVLIDILLNKSAWHVWSLRQVADLRETRTLTVNAIVVAEIAPMYQSQAELDRFFDDDVYEQITIPSDVGWIAGRAFLRYRSAGGKRTTTLPDFFIGAHAQVAGLAILTRDAARYRTYFPDVELIAPSGE